MIVIIGNGISGITAARHLRKNSEECITVISSETKHFFSRTALMYIYMGHMKFEHTKPYEDWFWDKNRIDLKYAHVDKIDFDQKMLHFSNGEKMDYNKLILAVGSKPNKFGWPGQELKGVGGLYSYQDLQYMEEHTAGIKEAVIIGGGLIGVEMAEMLTSRNIKVTFLIREKHYWGKILSEKESDLIERQMKLHHVELLKETELEEILDDGNGRVAAIKTKNGERINCQWVGLTAGVRPNTDFLSNTLLEINKGILVNKYLETNIKDVYAIGDCAEFREPLEDRGPLEQVWYTGKIMGETVANTITMDRMAYNPGIWYNSAKFFDIEYQTYGKIPAKVEDGHEHFFWEDSSGTKAMRFAFKKDDRKFLGINSFGIRIRHSSFQEYLTKNRTIDYVMEHLMDAKFDPEFYRDHMNDIVADFNRINSTSIKPKKFNWNRLLSYKS